MLAMPLSKSQIEAASKFWEDGYWETAEFAQLKRCFPKSQDAVKLKAVAINALYNTNILAIEKVADTLNEALKKMLNENQSAGPDLVEALVAEIKKVHNRQEHVFVAKFAHFFVNPDLPILDWYAEWMVARHLGTASSHNPKRYLKFVEDTEKLKELAGLTCTCDQLDHYLWVAGQYWYWKRNRNVRINSDLKNRFERLEENPEDEPILRNLLGLAQAAPA